MYASKRDSFLVLAECTAQDLNSKLVFLADIIYAKQYLVYIEIITDSTRSDIMLLLQFLRMLVSLLITV
jgi:hypothetical protein